jgi:beta-glucosidase
VVVLIGGRPLAIPALAERAPAIVEAWYLGQEGGTALAEVLFGDVNPSGKLTVSFPRSVGQVPLHYNRKPSARRGYLFTSASPLFPFGHGLSYTRFEYGQPEVEPARISRDGRATVGVEVRNAGTRPGDEIVQLYIRDRQSSLPRPVLELAGFTRVHLEPGQSRRVELELGPEQLALWDARMSRVVEPGWFDVSVGGSSVDLRSTALEVTEGP